MRVAVISGARAAEPMGLDLAELRLLRALRDAPTDLSLDIRVVGGRSARRYAQRLDARWVPARGESLPRIALRGADLIHLAGLDFPPPHRKPFVAMLYDLSPLHYNDEGVLPPWLDDVVERARVIFTISEFIAAELVERAAVPAERVRVIKLAPALDARDAEPLSRDELRQLGIEPPFVLRLGGYTRRKNVPLLLEAWAQVTSGTLVLAGPPQPARASILAGAPSLDRIVILDYVPQPLLARLLRSAAALVTTSSYEGFGLPPLEAMAAATPVVAVTAPFVREVCGDAALLVERRPEALANALGRVLVDEELARRLRAAGPPQAAGFTWSDAAVTVLSAYATAFE